MNFGDGILYLIILIFSVVIHEVAHGFAAYKNGDETAALSGRLSLNPISHIDLFGSIILPGLLLLTGSKILLGWAKPVPVNTNNFINQKKGILQVSLSGVMANFVLAIVFVNLVLSFFNLMPIPPLDGSKVLFVLLPQKYSYIESFMNKYSFIILIIFVFLVSWKILEPF